MPPDRYSLTQRVLHWVIALSVIGLLAIGLTLGTLGFDGTKKTFGMEVTNLLYKYHKTFGVLVLGLMLLRVVIRRVVPPPPHDPPLPAWKANAARANHLALYGLLLIQPVLGWAATAAGGFPIEFFEWKLPALIAKDKALSETLYGLHGTVGWLILALVALHIGAAIHHWLIRRDGVIRRITLP